MEFKYSAHTIGYPNEILVLSLDFGLWSLDSPVPFRDSAKFRFTNKTNRENESGIEQQIQIWKKRQGGFRVQAPQGLETGRITERNFPSSLH